MMNKVLAFLVVAALAGCASHRHADQAIAKLKIGMTETQARDLLKPHTVDTGTIYGGGSGARRIYFQISDTKQIWIDMGAGPDGTIRWLGNKEPKQKWTRHYGDSITVGDDPTTK